jgi:hypothetical protein
MKNSQCVPGDSLLTGFKIGIHHPVVKLFLNHKKKIKIALSLFISNYFRTFSAGTENRIRESYK